MASGGDDQEEGTKANLSFLEGAVFGFIMALVLAGWWGFSEGIGVSGDSYVWPFQLVTTDVWVTGDIFLTLTGLVAGLALLFAKRELSR